MLGVSCWSRERPASSFGFVTTRDDLLVAASPGVDPGRRLGGDQSPDGMQHLLVRAK